MPSLEFVRREIEYMRGQVGRQRKEILTLQRAGIPTTSAEEFLHRMLDKIDGLCVERDKRKVDLPRPARGKVLGGRKWSMQINSSARDASGNRMVRLYPRL